MALEFLTNLMTTYPEVSLVIISFLVTLLTTLVTKYVTNQDRMKELKQIQKACQIKVKENASNPAELQKINKQMMECSMELMKHSFKPMFITLLPLLLLFWGLRIVYTPVFPQWIWWYIISSIIFSIALRKILKVV